MKKICYIVLPLLLIVCLAASIIINVVAIRALKFMKIMDYNQIGLATLINADITETYVDEGNNPNLQGVFSDEEIINQLYDIIKKGCYQKCPTNTIIDSSPGSGSYPFIRLTTSDHTFAIAIVGNKVRISVDGISECYYSNIRTEINNLIHEILGKYFMK